MKSEEFDLLFDQAMAEVSRNHEFTPNPEASWAPMQRQLARRRRRRSRLRMLPYIVVSFLVGALILGMPVTSQAYPFFKVVEKIGNGVVHLVFGSDSDSSVKPKTLPPPDGAPEQSASPSQAESGNVIQQEFHSLEEAGKAVSFPPPRMGYVPERFVLDVIYTFSDNHADGKAYSMALIYHDAEGRVLQYVATKLKPGEKTSMGSGSAGDGEFRKIKIGASDAYLQILNEGALCSLDYLKGDLLLSMTGFMSEEEIIKLAKEAY